MRNIISPPRRVNTNLPDQSSDPVDPVLDLEALPPGRRFTAGDGHRYIRTNLVCYGFCDLTNGQLCSARDICTKHGGATGITTARKNTACKT